MLKPDYLEGSIVNLMASIGGAIGSTAGGYAPLEILPPGRLRRYRTIVLLLVDGLGYEFLAGNHPGSRLFQHCERPLTSVFPPTTASAVTSFFTAVAPQQHAITGWFTYLEEVASVATVLPFHPRLGGPSYQAQGITLRQVIGRASMFDAAVERACHVVTAGYLVDSEYSAATGGTAERHGYRDLDGLFEQLRRLVVRAADPQYLFAYWPQLDGLAHEHGVGSPEVNDHFLALDAAFGRFLDRVRDTDTIVVAVADHGLVDTSPERTVRLDAHPELAGTLRLPLCGEPRAAYCYLRPGARADFERYVADELGEYGALTPGAELIEAGYFGLGPPHPRLRERVGDYVLMMKDGYSITDRVPGEAPFNQVGVHGGLSLDELLVPLVIVAP